MEWTVGSEVESKMEHMGGSLNIGITGTFLGFYGNNGKENGNY